VFFFVCSSSLICSQTVTEEDNKTSIATMRLSGLIFVALTLSSLLCFPTLGQEQTDEDVVFTLPDIPEGPDVVFVELFDEDWESRWTMSTKEKYSG